MIKTTTKQLFVKKLYDGFTITEDGKERAIESNESLRDAIKRNMNFVNTVITNPTAQNFGLTIILEENIPQSK